MLTARDVAVLFVAAGASLVAQSTVVVSGGGAALQSAINLASPGDTLIVNAGIYTPVLCTRGLRLELQPGAEVGAPNSSTLAVRLQAIPASDTFVLTGGLVFGVGADACAGAIVVDRAELRGGPGPLVPPMVWNACTGPVVFDEVAFAPPAVTAQGQLRISNCAQVSLRECHLPSLVLSGSRVALADCTVRPIGVASAVAGLHQTSGRVSICGGAISGSFLFSLPIPTAGIRIDTGELVLTGGALVQRASWLPVSGPSIEANGGIVRLDPSVTVLGTPPITGAGTVLTTPIPSLAVSHTATTMTVALAGGPGSALITFAGLPIAPYTTPWGDAWLLPTDPILDLVVLPASGTSSFARTFAAVPSWFVLTLQSVELSAAGALTIGAPVRFAWN